MYDDENTKDGIGHLIALAVLSILFLLLIAGDVWVQFFAPCQYLGYLTMNNLPARCSVFLKS